MKLTTNNYYANIYLKKAKLLGISSEIILSSGLVKLFTDKKECLFLRAIPQINSALSLEICEKKHLSSSLLKMANLPIPKQIVLKSTNYSKMINNFPTPFVIKPSDGIGGKDVYANIVDINEGIRIAKNLLKRHEKVLIEEFVQGEDYRFLVLDNKVIGIVKRSAPTITGDGKSQIKRLISDLPSSKKIVIDDSMKSFIKKNNYSLTDILEKDKQLYIRSNANCSTGGTSETLKSSQVHPQLIKLAIDAAKTTYTRLAGVDLLIKDITKSIKNNAVIIEINHNPGSKMHHNPDIGEAQDVVTIILKKIFNL